MSVSSIFKKDLLAIGCGPSNLSLIALWIGAGQSGSVILDRSSSFTWHSGMQLPGAELQVSFLKDLVTLADPTNPYSFLSYLKSTGSIYRTLVASRYSVSRKAFEKYYNWAINRLEAVEFNTEATAITMGTDGFHVETNSGRYVASNVSVGIGKKPYVPNFDDPDRTRYHSANFMERAPASYAGQDICVVGGGQSAAEIVEYLLNLPTPPATIHWICRRPMLLPLDDSPFVNEIYTPAFAEYFYSLPEAARARLNESLKMTSDGISMRTLESLYSRLYRNNIETESHTSVHLKCSCEVLNVAKRHEGRRSVTTRNTLTDFREEFDCDKVLYATGYRYETPAFLDGIATLLTFLPSGEICLNEDFSARLKTSKKARLFLQNAGVSQFGLADQNLSLSAWRSAKIVNSILGREYYTLDKESVATSFPLSQQGAPHSRKIAV
ncbi:lysine N(6)-hydroxylase/L-ornithine N(5)-oxygenase family protein [Nitratireductor indicus]|nr:SidA/IucD/PvdA family monooxygenase [Nitratireductor indicus]SFQ48868.1 lysine N6-hydroxylase [Nitratireductor indicus]